MDNLKRCPYAADVTAMSQSLHRASWLCRDDADRERMVDMERRIKPMRTLTFVLMAAALVFAGPWEGWWTLLPLAVAAVCFAVADALIVRVARPEFAVAAAWITSQLLIAASIALTGGIHSPALGWLAIPIVTLSARFNARGVAAGMGLTVVLLLASTLAIAPQEVLDRPDRLVHALVLVAAVAMLSSALMESDLEHRSESVLDGLTGMLNRRSLSARVAELTEQSQVAGAAIGLIVGDIDNFKAVNDEHGHTTGDAVLVDVAYALRKELRAFDMAYRLGGEEFLVLMPGADAEQAAEVAERLRMAVGAFPAGGVDVTMSFGVATSQGGRFDYDAVFAAADAALYDAKRSGRDRVVCAGATAGDAGSAAA
jgi:diguanylate cyclase (GGDEF)-like protein